MHLDATPIASQPTDEPTIELLFLGDIVGRPGRHAIHYFLKTMPADQQPDVVIANGENTTHGFGLSHKHYQELRDSGVDIITGGNHTWDRKEILNYIDEADRLVRPANIPADVPGTGFKVFEVTSRRDPNKIITLGMINLLGQVYMGNYDSPYKALKDGIDGLKTVTPILFIDFHAEATAEKIALAHCAAELKVSAMVGTHTHVQTADAKILREWTGYLTDAGFNGAYDSVIGMDVENSVFRIKSTLPSRMDVASSNTLQINGVRFTLEEHTGRCVAVTPFQAVFNTPENAPEASAS